LQRSPIAIQHDHMGVGGQEARGTNPAGQIACFNPICDEPEHEKGAPGMAQMLAREERPENFGLAPERRDQGL
jgi:hypothetical protein